MKTTINIYIKEMKILKLMEIIVLLIPKATFAYTQIWNASPMSGIKQCVFKELHRS